MRDTGFPSLCSPICPPAQMSRELLSRLAPIQSDGQPGLCETGAALRLHRVRFRDHGFVAEFFKSGWLIAIVSDRAIVADHTPASGPAIRIHRRIGCPSSLVLTIFRVATGSSSTSILGGLHYEYGLERAA
jgi:hypothetical protein